MGYFEEVSDLAALLEASERGLERAARTFMMNLWRPWLPIIALFVLFPILFHPWWLFVLSAAVFSFLAWLLLPKNPK